MPLAPGYRSRPTARRGLLALAVVGLALTGCQHTLQAGQDRTVSVALSEYRLAPDKVRASSGLLTVVVHNYGRLTHNLAITRNGFTAGETTPIPPGSTTQISLFLPPGSYTMVSTMFEDESLGLHGKLTITR